MDFLISAKNIIAFAKEANASINHISTTSVSGNYLVKNSLKHDFTENDFYIGQNYKDNVYVRTKFEAEEEMLKEVEKLRKATDDLEKLLDYLDSHLEELKN